MDQPGRTAKGTKTCSTLVTLTQKNIDSKALAVHGPMLLTVAMAFKGRAGKCCFKGVAHWGPPMGVHPQEVKVKVFQGLGYMYRLSRDAGTWAVGCTSQYSTSKCGAR